MKIGIIGAGYSGTALAANLHRFSKHPIEVFLCEQRSSFGLGDAYSTPYPYHLLNVRAADMSAFECEHQHFVDWLKKETKIENCENQFVPRLLYGKYLQSLILQMQNTDKPFKLHCIPHEIKAITQIGNQAVLHTNARNFNVDKVVIAIGNNTPANFSFQINDSVKTIMNPWDFTAPKAIPSDSTVLIVGTGLSMIDTVLTLHHQHHQGVIFAVSRHGLLPLPHTESQFSYELDSDLPTDLRQLMQALRKHADEHVARGGEWQNVINNFRHLVADRWVKLSDKQKKQFLRHPLAYWNVHRHRVPKEIFNLLQTKIKTGNLKIIAGRLVGVEKKEAIIKKRQSHDTIRISIDWLINCMGPSLKMETKKTLLQSIIASGIVTLDELKLGIKTNKIGAILTSSGEYSKMFYTLGSLTRGTHWEITSVPDIRKQCAELANYLLSQ